MVGGSPEWRAFERYVADLFRATGAYEVRHDERSGGSQIDVWVKELTPTRGQITTVVECKYYSSPVGVGIVREFEKNSSPLRRSGRADRALMVAANGYTKDARAEAVKTASSLGRSAIWRGLQNNRPPASRRTRGNFSRVLATAAEWSESSSGAPNP